MFLALFAVGMFFVFIGALLLPTIVFAPQKVCLLLNLGFILILSSFGYLNGFYNTFVREFVEDGVRNKAFKLGFFGSMLLSLYASMVIKSYFVTIFCLIFETIMVLYFVCDKFPGGKNGLTFVLKKGTVLVGDCFKRVVSRS
jgi:hypothetical protein